MKTKSIAFIAMGAAIIAALGIVPGIQLGGSGVPITLQSMAIMAIGGLLGARRGFLSVVVFLLLVAAGAPLLSGGRGGWSVFVGPSAGYLFSWPFAAFLIGYSIDKIRVFPVFATALLSSVLFGIGFVYLMGSLGLMITMKTPFLAALAQNVVFLPGDAIKAVAASLFISKMANVPFVKERQRRHVA